MNLEYQTYFLQSYKNSYNSFERSAMQQFFNKNRERRLLIGGADDYEDACPLTFLTLALVQFSL